MKKETDYVQHQRTLTTKLYNKKHLAGDKKASNLSKRDNFDKARNMLDFLMLDSFKSQLDTAKENTILQTDV